METQVEIEKEERIDDVPLLLGMMDHMKIAQTLDKHLGSHHLRQGLSLGNLAVGWIAYILSQSDHRKSAVQDWAIGLEHSLSSFFGAPLRPQEFSDDRLGILLKHLDTADWDDLENDLFRGCFEVHQLPTEVFRVDATATCGYHEITPEGIMQLGHSKDHRPDLPQLKIMAAVTQPLAFPVATNIVSGDQADDGLYWNTIVKVKETVEGTGLLFVGDCKMAALATRARIANAKDFYLSPLPNTGDTAKHLGEWIDTAVSMEHQGQLQPICKPASEGQDAEVIGKGYEFTRTHSSEVDGKQVVWEERVQVVQAETQRESQKTKLEKQLQQAESKLGRLSLAGKGRKVWRDEQELRQAVVAIEKDHGVEGLLSVEIAEERQEKRKYDTPGRPSDKAVAEVAVESRYRIKEIKRVEGEMTKRVERLGWRAFVTNTTKEKLTLQGSVLTYREGGALERPFHELKGAPLGIRPLMVRLNEQIVGLTRLLLIALRVLTLVEIVLRAKLAETGEKLPGMYEGQKNKLEGKPTAKRMLRAIAGLKMTLSLIRVGDRECWYLKKLPELLVRVLALLGLPVSLYANLVNSAAPSDCCCLTGSVPVPSG